jgi:hypothetical protein
MALDRIHRDELEKLLLRSMRGDQGDLYLLSRVALSLDDSLRALEHAVERAKQIGQSG